MGQLCFMDVRGKRAMARDCGPPSDRYLFLYSQPLVALFGREKHAAPIQTGKSKRNAVTYDRAKRWFTTRLVMPLLIKTTCSGLLMLRLKDDKRVSLGYE